MLLPLVLPLLLVAWTLRVACGQQGYAERNVLPAPSSPDASYREGYDDYYYNEDYYDGREDLSFREVEDEDIYRWNVEEFPHPVNASKFCNRIKPSYVCDPDSVLEKAEADLLDDYIRKLYHETPCICNTCQEEEGGGIVVGIALLKYMFHPYKVHHAKVIRAFAQSLRTKWNLGRCDNDILIVVSTMDRLSYTDVGSTTSRYLSLHEAHRIFLENKAKFTAFNFSEGLMDILRGYHRATRGMRKEADGADMMDTFQVAGFIVGSVLLVGVVLFLGVLVYRRCKRGKDTVDGESEVKRGAGATVSSSWSKKDIKVLFGPERKPSPARYQKCGTDDRHSKEEQEEEEGEEDAKMVFTLASPDDASFADNNRTQLTDATSAESVELERDLATATEGLVKTFPSPNGRRGNVVLVTDM